MQTFRNHERILDPVPGGVVQALGELEHASGKAAAQRGQHRAALKTLVEVARIQSTEASNAIEDITAPPARLRALMSEMTAPANWSEAQDDGGIRDQATRGQGLHPLANRRRVLAR